MSEQLLTALNKIEELNKKFDIIFESDLLIIEKSKLEINRLKSKTRKIYTELRALKSTLKTIDKSFLIKTDPNYLNTINQVNQRIESLVFTLNEDINIPFIKLLEDRLIENKRENLVSQKTYQDIKSILFTESKNRDSEDILKQTEVLISTIIDKSFTKFKDAFEERFTRIEEILEQKKLEQNKQFKNFLGNQHAIIDFLKELENPQDVGNLLTNDVIVNLLNQIHEENLDTNKKLDIIGAEIFKNKCPLTFQIKNAYFKRGLYIVEEDFEIEIEINPQFGAAGFIEYILFNQQPKNCYLEDNKHFTEEYLNFHKLNVEKTYNSEKKIMKLNLFTSQDEGNLQIIIIGTINIENNTFPFMSDTRFHLKRGKIKREKLKTISRIIATFLLKEGTNIAGFFLPPQ